MKKVYISMRTVTIKNFLGPMQNTRASALISLIAAILIISVLAAAIIPMIGSSSQQTGTANMATKAYLLAESGFRYAAAKYLHAGSTEQSRNQELEDLEGNYTLSDGNSKFQIDLYSYFYEAINNINSGDLSFKAHTPGTFPDDILLVPGLQIQIEDQIYTLSSGTQTVSGEDDNVTMTVSSSMAFYPAGTIAYPVADADSGRTPGISHGGNIAYDNGHGELFPLRNGRIRMNDRVLTYSFNDRANNRFVNVQDPNDPGMSNVSIPSGSKIVLTKYVRLRSTGIYGSGSMQTRRQVTYYTPLPLSDSDTVSKEFTERFNAKDNWQDRSGTTSTTTIDGNSALKVDSTASSGDDLGTLTSFNPSSTAAREIDLNASTRASRGFLSYDIQVKTGFENTPVPDLGFTPPASSVPTYFAAGLFFRLSNADAGLFSSNGYGISFIRSNSGVSSPTVDGIPDDISVLTDRKTIVLWQQTGDGSDRTWLAYKEMVDLLFNEDTEDSGNDQFSEIESINLWDTEEGGRQRSGSSRNWYYGLNSTHTYNLFGFRHFGTIQSNLIVIPDGYSKVTLKFWGWHETEPQRSGFGLNDFDRKSVIIVDDDGDTLSTHIIGTEAAPGDWYQEEIDMSSYAGQSIRIRFHFDTIDGANNDYEGWYIDDVQVIAEWPVDDSTLAVGIQEALVVRFNNGFPKIREGDKIFGNSRGTIGVVMAPPILTSGDWTSTSPAQGTLLLNRTSVTTAEDAFVNSEQLTVIGGTGSADVIGYNEPRDRKANIIKVYFASSDGIGTANTDPTDLNTRGYARLGVSDSPHWPPFVNAEGNWFVDDGLFTASEDYFRLIEWDAVNTGAVSGLSTLQFRTNDQGVISNSIIQSHHDQLQSPNFPGILSQAEIGLHAFGDGARNVFFDDFGIRIDVSENDTIPTPLQQ